MTRRRFIIGLLALAVVFIGGAILVIPFEKVVGKILRTQLSFLKLENAAVDSFTRDMASSGYYEKKSFDWKKQLFVRIYHFFENPLIPIPGRGRYDAYCTFFVNDFLLSTDFFLNKMDESKTVTYIALFEPYKRPCSNPFSNLYYPAA